VCRGIDAEIVCHLAQLVCRFGQWFPASKIGDVGGATLAACHPARASA
jgi:hypothetical protein